MGFFSKLTKQMSKGGLEVTLAAPASIAVEDESVDMQVTVESSDDAQTIKNIYAELELQRTSSRWNQSSKMNEQYTNTMTLARVDRGPTTINANDVQNLTVTLPLGSLRTSAAGDIDLGSGAFANAAEQLIRMGTSNQYQDRYSLRVVVELDGMRDPSDSHWVTVVGAGNQGASFGFHLDG